MTLKREGLREDVEGKELPGPLASVKPPVRRQEGVEGAGAGQDAEPRDHGVPDRAMRRRVQE